MTDSTTTPESIELDPNASPWPVPPVEGIPFDKDSEEARAIERIIRWSEEGAGERTPPASDSSEATPA